MIFEPQDLEVRIQGSPLHAILLLSFVLLNFSLLSCRKHCNLCVKKSFIQAISSEINFFQVASPATVSRCGMVYYEPQTMGLYPSLASWLNTLPETMTEANKSMIESLFRWLVPPCIKLIRKELKEICPTSDIQLAWSFFKMFSSLLTAFKVEPKKFALTEKEVIVHIECIFLVSMTWSVCCSVDRAGREKFDSFLREASAGTVPPPYSEEGERGNLTIGNQFPKEGSIYSHYFDAAKGKWATWSNLISKEPLSENLEPHEIIVPTIDTAR